MFQFTQPKRAATEAYIFGCAEVYVSIHAAQAGCDLPALKLPIMLSVSIHAAQAGCDLPALKLPIMLSVSIHAAQAGCDKQATCHYALLF